MQNMNHRMRLPMQFFAEEFGEDFIPAANPEEGFAEEKTEQKYPVRYNGEQRMLSMEELLREAQKGLNYDKVLAQRDRLRAGVEIDFLRRIAARNGMGIDEFILTDGGAAEEKPSEAALQALAEKRNGEQKAEAQMQLREALEVLAEAYPGLEEIPEEVARQIRRGDEPKQAYLSFENRRLREENEMLQQQIKNREHSTGSLRSSGSDWSDRFLESMAHELR